MLNVSRQLVAIVPALIAFASINVIISFAIICCSFAISTNRSSSISITGRRYNKYLYLHLPVNIRPHTFVSKQGGRLPRLSTFRIRKESNPSVVCWMCITTLITTTHVDYIQHSHVHKRSCIRVVHWASWHLLCFIQWANPTLSIASRSCQSSFLPTSH